MRADKFFAEKFGSRTKSAEAIEKGLVLINGKTIKPKDEVVETDEVTFIQPNEAFVSNGGYKLARAIDSFSVDCKNKVFVDLGASTGGFTDCLLQNGAKLVYAVDVGESLLHPSIANDKRIISIENCNARYLTDKDFDQRIDGVVTDVSFISLKLIFPSIKSILSKDGEAIVLIKPQFECDKKHIGKSGIVKPVLHADIVKKVIGYAQENGLYPFHITHAPIRKGKNIEYLLHLKTTKHQAMTDDTVIQTVKNLVKIHSTKQ